MSNSPHCKYTLLHESNSTRCLHEFQAEAFPDALIHMVDFFKGVGFMEETIHRGMKALADEYELYKKSLCSDEDFLGSAFPEGDKDLG